MRIKCKNKDTAKLFSPEVGEPIEFDDKGKARVKKDVGEKAVEIFDSVVKEHKTTTEVKEDGL